VKRSSGPALSNSQRKDSRRADPRNAIGSGVGPDCGPTNSRRPQPDLESCAVCRRAASACGCFHRPNAAGRVFAPMIGGLGLSAWPRNAGLLQANTGAGPRISGAYAAVVTPSRILRRPVDLPAMTPSPNARRFSLTPPCCPISSGSVATQKQKKNGRRAWRGMPDRDPASANHENSGTAGKLPARQAEVRVRVLLAAPPGTDQTGNHTGSRRRTTPRWLATATDELPGR